MSTPVSKVVRRVFAEGLIALIGAALIIWAWYADPFWVEQHASGLRCIENPRVLTTFSWARLLALGFAVFLVLVVRPRWVRLALSSKNVGSSALRYILAIFLAMLCAELVLRRPSSLPPGLAPDGYSPAHVPDPVLAWRLEPAAQHSWHEGGREFLYAVNDEGNRARSIHDDPNHDRPTILVGGESIAMGMGNPYEEAFPALLEARTRVQVVDLGVDAYGLDQTYIREKEVLSSFPHPVAIVTMFHPEMAERSEVEDRPRLRVDSAGHLQPLPPTPRWVRDIRLRQIFRGLYHSSTELDDLRALVRETAALARSRGAYPLFLTLNYSDPCLNVNGKEPLLFRALIDEQHVPRVHVILPAAERLSDDQHPGPAAHRRIADAVEKALRDAHVLG